MNANGVGTVDFNGNGFNPAAMAAGLAVEVQWDKILLVQCIE